MVLMGLARTGANQWPEGKAACGRAIRWLLAMQNSDGGWAAFDRDINREILTKVPFADHNAMLDPSTSDITARTLEMLSYYAFDTTDSRVDAAIQFIRKDQDLDGSQSRCGQPG